MSIRTWANLVAAVACATAGPPLLAVELHVPPYPTIQAAIDAASDGDEIIVAPGTYPEAINMRGKRIWLHSSGGPGVTIINATGLDNSVVKCVSGEDHNTILEGFTITGGRGDPATGRGGGMYLAGSVATVRNCRFVENHCQYPGGLGDGGAIYIFGTTGSPEMSITDCDFISNTAYAHGGAILVSFLGSLSVDRCSFIRNAAITQGVGGIYVSLAGSLEVSNSVFVGNTTPLDGGAIAFGGPSDTIVANCTFAYNSAGGRGGAVWLVSIQPTSGLRNCILWNNADATGDDVDYEGNVPSVTYSDVQGGFPGLGNIDADPLFLDADGVDNVPGTSDDDLRLSSASPCVDAGDTTALGCVIGYPSDLDGNARAVNRPQNTDAGVPVNGQVIDMGAFERPVPPACDANDDGIIDFFDIDAFLFCLFGI